MEELRCLRGGKIGKINVSVGDKVKKNDALLSIETEKGNMPLNSNCDGVIKELNYDEGEEVLAGDIIVKIEEVKSTEEQEQKENKKTTVNKDADLVIIGGGPGGYVAALRASQLGLSVIVVEKNKLGGTCLNVGCIPTKALVKSAELFEEIKSSNVYGIEVDNAKVDLKKVIQRKDKIVKKLVGGIGYLFKKKNIEFINGVGKIENKNTVIATTDVSNINISCKNIIVATGSAPAIIPIKGIDLKGVITSNELLEMTELPESLGIIGGGVIGMEFAFIYASFGVKVTVIEFLDSILPSLDKDVVDTVMSSAKKLNIDIYTSSKVKQIIEAKNDTLIINYENNGKSEYLTSKKVLMAVGRKPVGVTSNVELKPNPNGIGIKVDDHMRTNIKNIYAIGDVTGNIQLAHVASHQGIIAVENISGLDKAMDYDIIPSAIFTSPEIGTVGINEKVAKKMNIDYKVSTFPYSANGKSLTVEDDKGFIKILYNKATKEVIGATIVGTNAADILATVTVIIKNKISIEQVSETIFTHPTISEVVHEAFLGLDDRMLHYV